MEISVEEKDNHQKNSEAEDGYAPSGIALGLEFSLVGDEVALGEFHFCGNLALELVHKRADIAHTGLDGDGETALGIFAEDHIRALGLSHIGHGPEGERTPAIGLDGKAGDALRRFSPVWRQAEDEVDATLILAQFGDFLASKECAQARVEIPGGDSVAGAAFAVRLDTELRNQGLLVELGVLKARNRFRKRLNLRANVSKSVEIGAKDLDGHRCGDATHHVPDAVGQWASDHSKNAWDRLHPGSDVVEDFLAGAFITAALRSAEVHIEFSGRNGHDMVTAFRAPKSAADFLHLWHREYLLFNDIRDAVHLLQRGAGPRCRCDECGLLFEGG